MKSDLIITEPKSSLTTRILVALVFAGYFTYVIYLIAYKALFTRGDRVTVIIYLLILFYLLFFSLIRQVAQHKIHLNLDEMKIKHQFTAGLLNYNEKWQPLNKLEYISVFEEGGGYAINLWYETNKILNLMFFKEKKMAMEHGLIIADKLEIDLLDATKRGYHKWVDKTALKASIEKHPKEE